MSWLLLVACNPFRLKLQIGLQVLLEQKVSPFRLLICGIRLRAGRIVCGMFAPDRDECLGEENGKVDHRRRRRRRRFPRVRVSVSIQFNYCYDYYFVSRLLPQ